MKFSTQFFVLIFTIFAVLSCKNSSETTENESQTVEKTTPTLDEKIGQMLMIGFRGTDLTEDNHIYNDIKNLQIGGIVLYDYDLFSEGKLIRNIKNPEQVKALCQAIQDLATTDLLISIDQEGGKVNRLKTNYGFPKVGVSAQYLGTVDNLDSTHYYAKLTAELLDDLGINFNYAPVVDLNINPKSPAIGNIERSYSADAAVVTKHATAVLDVYKDYGIIGCLKHFPGHGSAAADSHLGITDITKTWKEIELEPYKNLIQEDKVEMIMTAHVYNENLDTLPATLSKKVMTDILRKQLKWEGIIISDDMHMGAIVQHYGLEVAIEKAINAGVDILMFSNNSREFYDAKAAEKAVETIKKLLEEGKITEAQIDNSYEKIMSLKESLKESLK
ncbi:MAG: glycoside hydrolase family 3 protein [Saprospiraceae bacterium]